MSGNKPKLEDLEKILLEVVKSENLSDHEVNLKNTTNKGDGFVGLISFVELKAKNPEGKEVTLQLVVKTAPTSGNLRSDVPIRLTFIQENYMYGVIHPKFRQFQKEHNVAKPFDSMATCYGNNSNQLEESLVLENLLASGYSLWNRKVPMNKEHITFVLKEYGKLHSLSHALRALEPAAFGKLTSHLRHNILFEFFKHSQGTITKFCERVVKTFDATKDAALIRSMRHFKNKMMHFLEVDAVKVDQYSVITHGDGWSNNMMFKYENIKATSPNKMRFLDWQATAFATPVLDLSYFLYNCSPPEVLDDLDAFLKIYHDSLTEHLYKFGLDSEKLYPFSKLQEQWRASGTYGFIGALVVVKIMLSDGDEAPDLASSAENGARGVDAFDYESPSDPEYYRRLRKVVRNLYERKCI